jgi:hypothetical protein
MNIFYLSRLFSSWSAEKVSSPRRYFPEGSLCLAGHSRNCVMRLDVGAERQTRDVEEVPRVPLLDIHVTPFLEYEQIVTVGEGLDRLELCGNMPVTSTARAHYELPIVGLTHHVLPVRYLAIRSVSYKSICTRVSSIKTDEIKISRKYTGH